MRFDLDSLLDATHLTLAQLADHLGVERTSLYRWKERGIPAEQTDSLAVRFGLVPYEIWDDWLDWSLDTADEVMAMRAARARLYYASNPEYRARQAAGARRYRRANHAKIAAAQALWISRNRDRVRAHARKHYATIKSDPEKLEARRATWRKYAAKTYQDPVKAEAIKERRRQWYRDNRERVLAEEKARYWADPEAKRAAKRVSRAS